METQGDPLQPVDLDAVLEGVLADLEVKVDESDAEITADELPGVKSDTSQLRQVFQNLLENAIEYSGDETPRVRVAVDGEGPEWIISVQDEGIGIDPGELTEFSTCFSAFIPARIPRDRDRACALQTNYRTSRRRDMGRIKPRFRIDVLLPYQFLIRIPSDWMTVPP